MKTKIKALMTENPRSCTPEASLQEAARMMAECDCGAIPVVQGDGARRVIGIITDRDVACRAVAQGKDPSQTKVSECMSRGLATVNEEDSIKDCCEAMEKAQVRRLLVLDIDGELCGIVSQADIALHLSKNKIAEVVKEVSQPAQSAKSG
jgi:CBS domain-containing protein